MKKFCTNCGKETSQKTCEHCGVKKYTTHSFCEWCGNPVNANAEICPACKEKIGKPSRLSSILGIIFFSLFVVVYSFDEARASNTLSIFLLFVCIVLVLPVTKGIIRNLTFDKPAKSILRVVINSIRIMLVIFLFCASIVNSTTTDVSYEIYKNEATAAAEVVFHEEVALKNESSFILNDSDVTYLTEPYNDNDNLRLVTVVLDYSAQNGLGGYNRNDYRIKLIFDTSTGKYYRLNGTLIEK